MPCDCNMLWEVIKASLAPLAVLLAAYFTYRFAFKNWQNQKDKELDYQLKQVHFSSKIEACKAAWGLLAYMSEKENDKTVIVSREEGSVIRRAQAVEYLKALPIVFYEQGHGLFLPVGVRDGLYGFRGQIYQVLDAERAKGNNNSETILLNKPQIVEFVTATRKVIADMLKEELKGE